MFRFRSGIRNEFRPNPPPGTQSPAHLGKQLPSRAGKPIPAAPKFSNRPNIMTDPKGALSIPRTRDLRATFRAASADRF